MSHSINLLEPNEIHYLSAAESNPLYKLGAVAVVVIILGLVALHYVSLQETIQEGENLSTRWAEIEDKVTEAEALTEKVSRIEEGLQTLQGWSASKVNWDEVMSYLAEEVPGAKEDMQFTRLEVSEKMVGLRNQFPGSKAADVHPLKREITIQLRGILRSSRPERLLTRFQRNLINGRPPVEFEEVALDRYTQLRQEDGSITDRTTFAFTIRLIPREVTP
jgi:hypothetical protein